MGAVALEGAGGLRQTPHEQNVSSTVRVRTRASERPRLRAQAASAKRPIHSSISLNWASTSLPSTGADQLIVTAISLAASAMTACSRDTCKVWAPWKTPPNEVNQEH